MKRYIVPLFTAALLWGGVYRLYAQIQPGGGGTTTSPGGSNTQVQFNSSGAFGGSANLTWVSPTLTIGVAGTTSGALTLANSGASSSVQFVTNGDGQLLLENNAGTKNILLSAATINLKSTGTFGWVSGTDASATNDTTLNRLAAASVGIGNNVSATNGDLQLATIEASGSIRAGTGAFIYFNGRGGFDTQGDGLLELVDNAASHNLQISSGTANPTLGSCGTGTIAAKSLNSVGEVTMTGSATCVVNFGTGGFGVAPWCIVSDKTTTGGAKITSGPTTSTFTITATSGDVVDYWCAASR